jgi:hypothetical protein
MATIVVSWDLKNGSTDPNFYKAVKDAAQNAQLGPTWNQRGRSLLIGTGLESQLLVAAASTLLVLSNPPGNIVVSTVHVTLFPDNSTGGV